MMGININCKHQDFIGEILSGKKTIETRNTPSLDPYLGQRQKVFKNNGFNGNERNASRSN